MMDIDFKITENDIKEYLKRHKDDENIKYREAMFVKYMKENGIVTKEALEIMMEKYNWDDESITGIYRYQDFKFLHQELSSFNTYLDNIKNLDISGICHIMIPCIKYYNCSEFRHSICASKANHIAELLGVNSYDEDGSVLLNTIDNYRVAELIEDYRTFSRITMSKEKSRRMIQEYSCIYGEEPVKLIRKGTRERVILGV